MQHCSLTASHFHSRKTLSRTSTDFPRTRNSFSASEFKCPARLPIRRWRAFCNRQPYSTEVNDSQRGWISRYAWGEDYHDAVMAKLRVVEQQLHQESGEQEAPELQTRCYLDTGPLVERVYAKYAGVGWIGKNTCILNQKLGSWLFLGVILTSLELEPDVPA